MTISTWTPLNRTISAITRANPAVVTTSVAHGYHDGLEVNFFFPANFGMTGLLGNTYEITVLSDTTFSIPVDSSNFEPFSLSVTTQSPQVIPAGEIAETLINAERNTLTPVGG